MNYIGFQLFDLYAHYVHVDNEFCLDFFCLTKCTSDKHTVCSQQCNIVKKSSGNIEYTVSIFKQFSHN